MTADADLFDQARAGALVEHCRALHRHQRDQALERRRRRDAEAIRRR